MRKAFIMFPNFGKLDKLNEYVYNKKWYRALECLKDLYKTLYELPTDKFDYEHMDLKVNDIDKILTSYPEDTLSVKFREQYKEFKEWVAWAHCFLPVTVEDLIYK